MTDVEITGWNWDKPHRCPRCHTVHYGQRDMALGRHLCCRCGTIFAREPRGAARLPLTTCENVPNGVCGHFGDRYLLPEDFTVEDYVDLAFLGAQQAIGFVSTVPYAVWSPLPELSYLDCPSTEVRLSDISPERVPGHVWSALRRAVSAFVAEHWSDVRRIPAPYYLGYDYVLSRETELPDWGIIEVDSSIPDVRHRLHRTARDLGRLVVSFAENGDMRLDEN